MTSRKQLTKASAIYAGHMSASRPRRPDPPPLEVDESKVIAVGVVCWAVALVVLLACHSQLARDTLIVPGFRSSRIHLLDISDVRRDGLAAHLVLPRYFGGQLAHPLINK